MYIVGTQYVHIWKLRIQVVQMILVAEVMVHVRSQCCIREEMPKHLLAEVRNGGGSDEVRCSGGDVK